MKRTRKKRQVMVITGATSGIGRATAMEWAKRGGTVVLAARSREVLEKVATNCEEAGGKALVVQADVSKEEEVNKLAEKAVPLDLWQNRCLAK
jgi:short-subunit dehydrogenase